MPPRFLDVLQIRTDIITAARDMVGFGSTGPRERQDHYAKFIFPHPDDAKNRDAWADSMYSCGLVARGCLRVAEIDSDLTTAAYVPGAIMAWLSKIAGDAYTNLGTEAAVKTFFAQGGSVEAGDIIVVQTPGIQASTHVIVITSKDAEESGPGQWADVYTTAEGGVPEVSETGEHGMSVASRRLIVRHAANGLLQTGTWSPDGKHVWGRFVIYMIESLRLRSRKE